MVQVTGYHFADCDVTAAPVQVGKYFSVSVLFSLLFFRFSFVSVFANLSISVC